MFHVKGSCVWFLDKRKEATVGLSQYKDFRSRSKQPNFDDDDIPMSREEEAKFMQTFNRTCFYNDYRDCDSNHDNWRSRNDYNRDNYQSHSDDKSDLQKQLSDFIKAQHSTNSFVKDTFMDLKSKLETTTKNHQALIQNLKAKFDRFADKKSARNEHVNAISTRSGKSYDSPVNPNDQQNNFETPINFDSIDEDDEPTPQPKPKNLKPVKEISTPKPYKPKVPYPQRLRKEKMEAQYGKFLDMIRAVRINVPLVDVLAGMPNYGKVLKELVNNKHKIKQFSFAFISDESSTILQNKVPPKLGDPGSFLTPCNFYKAFSCNALSNLGASINLMSYSLYVKLSLKTLKPTKMSVRLADRSFQYLVGIAENMLVEVVGTKRMIFSIDSAIKHSYSNDDTCFSIDVIDEILEEDFDALLDEGSEILHSIEGTILKEKPFPEFDEFMAMTADENSEYTLAIFHDMIEESVEVFIDDFSVFGSSFDHCLNNLDKMIQHCEDTHLILNWEKCHFMVKEGIVLGHKVFEAVLEVDKAKIDVISKLPPPTIIKVVHTNHSALRHLFKKQDAKPRLIRWILLLQEFDIEIKDRKGTEYVAADHLSRIEKEETSDDSEVDDNFPGETLIKINTKDDLWFTDFANYLVSDIITKGMTYQQKNKFFFDIKHYFWEEP
ncbi:reverse transcriptase domain-containing protein [Tanacetum coccineum]